MERNVLFISVLFVFGVNSDNSELLNNSKIISIGLEKFWYPTRAHRSFCEFFVPEVIDLMSNAFFECHNMYYH